MKNNKIFSVKDKDIIIFAGPAGSGKTTAIEIARGHLLSRNISSEEEIVNGFSILVEKVRLDDKSGGFSHYHPWCDKKASGHIHKDTLTPILPFIITGNQLWESMLSEVMDSLSKLPRKNKIWFFELAGGININPKDEPASAVDHSFRMIKENLQNGVFSSAWLQRTLSVIHVDTDFAVRYELNKKKKSNLAGMIEEKTKTAFAYKLPTLMNIYGNDDFDELRCFLKEKNIVSYEVQNDGTNLFEKSISSILNRVLSEKSY